MARIRADTVLKVFLAACLVGLLALPFILRPAAHRNKEAVKPSGPTRKLVIISPHWEGIRAEFERAFSEWTIARFGHATDIEWPDVGGTSEAVKFVRSEFERSPSGINIDMFFGGGVDPYITFVKSGLLSPCSVPKEILAAIPPTYSGITLYDPEERWFGAALSGFGIIYNRKVCRMLRLPEPASWADLARPEYFTWVAVGDPRSSGSIHMVYEIILQAYGWEKGWATLIGMCANARTFARGAGDVPKDVAVGEAACGIAIDVYGWRQVEEVGADRMGFLLPEGVTVINPDGIAVLKGAPNKDLAEKFVEFVLSEEGQKLWCLKKGAAGGPRDFVLGRMPVIPGLALRNPADSAVPQDAFAMKSGFTYDLAKGSVRWAALNDLVGAVMIDAHNELEAAWKVACRLPADDERSRRLLTPPMTEEAFAALAKEKWDSAEARARIRAEWATEAKQRYRLVAAGG